MVRRTCCSPARRSAATAWPVAALRPGACRDAMHDVTCSVGAELAELVRTADRVVGPISTRAPAWPHTTPGRWCVADALAPPTRDTVVVADPARRAGGRRIHDPARQATAAALLETVAARDHAPARRA